MEKLLSFCQRKCNFAFPKSIKKNEESNSYHLTLTWPNLNNSIILSTILINSSKSKSWELVDQSITLTTSKEKENETRVSIQVVVPCNSLLRVMIMITPSNPTVYDGLITFPCCQQNTVQAIWNLTLVSLKPEEEGKGVEDSLVLAEIHWTFPSFKDSASNPFNKSYLLTWELFGGGWKGNLITDMESTIINLLKDSSYLVQVCNSFQFNPCFVLVIKKFSLFCVPGGVNRFNKL